MSAGDVSVILEHASRIIHLATSTGDPLALEELGITLQTPAGFVAGFVVSLYQAVNKPQARGVLALLRKLALDPRWECCNQDARSLHALCEVIAGVLSVPSQALEAQTREVLSALAVRTGDADYVGIIFQTHLLLSVRQGSTGATVCVRLHDETLWGAVLQAQADGEIRVRSTDGGDFPFRRSPPTQYGASLENVLQNATFVLEIMQARTEGPPVAGGASAAAHATQAAALADAVFCSRIVDESWRIRLLARLFSTDADEASSVASAALRRDPGQCAFPLLVSSSDCGYSCLQSISSSDELCNRLIRGLLDACQDARGIVDRSKALQEAGDAGVLLVCDMTRALCIVSMEDVDSIVEATLSLQASTYPPPARARETVLRICDALLEASLARGQQGGYNSAPYLCALCGALVGVQAISSRFETEKPRAMQEFQGIGSCSVSGCTGTCTSPAAPLAVRENDVWLRAATAVATMITGTAPLSHCARVMSHVAGALAKSLCATQTVLHFLVRHGDVDAVAALLCSPDVETALESSDAATLQLVGAVRGVLLQGVDEQMHVATAAAAALTVNDSIVRALQAHPACAIDIVQAFPRTAADEVAEVALAAGGTVCKAAVHHIVSRAGGTTQCEPFQLTMAMGAPSTGGSCAPEDHEIELQGGNEQLPRVARAVRLWIQWCPGARPVANALLGALASPENVSSREVALFALAYGVTVPPAMASGLLDIAARTDGDAEARADAGSAAILQGSSDDGHSLAAGLAMVSGLPCEEAALVLAASIRAHGGDGGPSDSALAAALLSWGAQLSDSSLSATAVAAVLSAAADAAPRALAYACSNLSFATAVTSTASQEHAPDDDAVVVGRALCAVTDALGLHFFDGVREPLVADIAARAARNAWQAACERRGEHAVSAWASLAARTLRVAPEVAARSIQANVPTMAYSALLGAKTRPRRAAELLQHKAAAMERGGGAGKGR